VSPSGRLGNVKMMRWLAGVLAVVALALTGCGGTTSGPATGGADIVPADATMFIALNSDADSEQWQAADDLASRFPDKQDAVTAIKDGLRQEGFDWDRDVKAALGPEFDFVWLDLEQDGQDFVVITQPKDEGKFDRLVAKMQESSGDVFRGRLGDWELLGPNQAAIDRFKRESESSDSKLSDNDGFNDAMSSYPDDALMRFYLSGPEITELARRELKPDERKYIDELGQLDWIAADVSATSEGLRFDMNAHGKAGPALRNAVPVRPFDAALTHEVPRDAIAYWTFHGAKGMLTGLEDNPIFKDNPDLHRYSNVLRRIDSLLQGENALYLRPASGKTPEVTFVAEPAPGTNGVAMVDQLIARYSAELGFPTLPMRSRVAGLPARTIDLDVFKVHYANVGKRLVLTNLPAGFKALRGNPPSLAESKDFKGAVDSAGMPAKTQGFVYVNVSGGLSYAERLAGTKIPGQIRRNVRPLRSIVEYAATRPSELQVTFFLRIK
jgi:hypothetical protein